MDAVFANRISYGIFKQCGSRLIDQQKYTDVPIELRKRLEDCFDSYMEQHQSVMKGINQLPITPTAMH